MAQSLSFAKASIIVDAKAGTIDLDIDPQDFAARKAAWQPRPTAQLAGALEKYARLVGPTHEGAVTHAGKVIWAYEEPDAA